MPTADAAFIAKVREQIEFLRNKAYIYDQLLLYVSGIAEPWAFGPEDEFEFGEEVLVVRGGPTEQQGNYGVPEHVFPLRHIVATELAVSGE